MSYEIQQVTVERCGDTKNSTVITYTVGYWGVDMIERHEDGSVSVHFGTSNHTHTFPRDEVRRAA